MPDVILRIPSTPPVRVQVHPSPTVSVAAASSSQQFVQSVPAVIWTFNHTLNRRPGVHVTDLAGNALWAETTVTTTQVIVTLVAPLTGIVYLS